MAFDTGSLEQLREEAENSAANCKAEGMWGHAREWEIAAHTYKTLAEVSAEDDDEERSMLECIVEQYAGEVAELRAEIDFLKGQLYGKGHASWK